VVAVSSDVPGHDTDPLQQQPRMKFGEQVGKIRDGKGSAFRNRCEDIWPLFMYGE
jgi:hypothetical protein